MVVCFSMNVTAVSLVALMFLSSIVDGSRLRRSIDLGRSQVKLSSARAAVTEDSAVIEGPDCGKARHVLPKYQKASKVGKVAGAAQGALSNAAAAAAAATIAATHAKEIGVAVNGTGDMPLAIDLAAKAAEDAAGIATAASETLETKLQTFEAKAASTDFSGSAIEAGDMVELKTLTQDVIDASKAANDAAARVTAKAKTVQADAVKTTQGFARKIAQAMHAAKPMVSEMANIGQKATWAVKDSQAIVAEADAVLTKLDAAKENASEQAPVWEAVKYNVSTRKGNLTTAAAALSAAVSELDVNATALKEKLEPLEIAASKAAGGSPVLDASEALGAAEQAKQEAEQSLSTVMAKMAAVTKRQSSVKEAVKAAEKKLSAKA
eukprot:TRINITY_DN63083_c0_g1_i1.p1 TRINITY_DN63083_c0_g1~~TRINITY_DN63083_c0_g1_i1.p1  ORF type:complete len:401 (-),score=117.22 TRINITY_DN63083_c0_g1_i1:132-1271(-)